MFMVYATTLTWAGLTNLCSVGSGGLGWAGFGLLQLFFAYRVLHQFRLFSAVHRALVEDGLPDRAARVFPVGAFLLGVTGLVGLLIALGNVIDHTTLQASEPAELLVGLTCDAAILGVALGVSSMLSGYRARALSMVGLVCGGTAVALWLVGLVF